MKGVATPEGIKHAETYGDVLLREEDEVEELFLLQVFAASNQLPFVIQGLHYTQLGSRLHTTTTTTEYIFIISSRHGPHATSQEVGVHHIIWCRL